MFPEEYFFAGPEDSKAGRAFALQITKPGTIDH